MKALELADKLATLDNFYFEESSRYDEFACQVVGDAEHELRRLAEVNAELLAALEAMHLQFRQSKVSLHWTNQEAINDLATVSVLAKAKEQQ